jgi:glycosyltransferase involved in cell wall biosynthesis
MRITVIITTYNWPEALFLSLQSLQSQRDGDFEIVVADDGSNSATRDLIAEFAGNGRSPVGHVWHEDTGFRAAAIRNRAIAASSGDYLVFLDGDCFVPADFIGVHRRLAEPGWLVSG